MYSSSVELTQSLLPIIHRLSAYRFSSEYQDNTKYLICERRLLARVNSYLDANLGLSDDYLGHSELRGHLHFGRFDTESQRNLS